MAVLFLLFFGFAGLYLAGIWNTFEKAGEPGWASLIPVYNLYVMSRIARMPEWWVLLFLIPIVNIVAWFQMNIGIAKNFGRSSLFGVGLSMLPFLFYPILGLGSDTYQQEPPSDNMSGIEDDEPSTYEDQDDRDENGHRIETIPVEKW
ncbi:MAG: DUF5684 domain-containing protein [Bacteroidia bacterium]|nr:DUF5684 domain-containing protein [Bacteroidia bacterium]